MKNYYRHIIRKTDEIVDRLKIRSFPNDYTELTLCKPVKKYAFVFICQAGGLEVGSLLLAASLKRFLKCDHELIAAIPSPQSIMGRPHDATLNILSSMRVRIVYINNDIVSENRRAKHHMITNKMYCLGIPTYSDKFIFIDSDFLCRKDFEGDTRFSIPFNARLVAWNGTRNFEGKWHKFYEALNVEMPNIRIRVENDNSVNYIPPCFNSGFFAVTNELVSELYRCWFECWHTIDRKGIVKHHPYHIGQFALAVAVSKMRIPYEIIEREWIYEHFFICHKPSELGKNEEAVRLALSLIEEYPEIIEIIKGTPEYNFLLERDIKSLSTK